MKIGNKEFDFDVADAECMERYEKALNEMQKRTKATSKGETASERMKHACQLVFDFFDQVVGEGTSKQLFGEKMNFRVCFTTYQEFISDCSRECDEFTQTLNQYSSNRAQRRVNK